MNMEIALITAHILLIYPKDPSEVKLSFFLPKRSIRGNLSFFTQEIHLDPSEGKILFLPKRSIRGKAFIFYPRDPSRSNCGTAYIFIQESIRGKALILYPRDPSEVKLSFFTQEVYPR